MKKVIPGELKLQFYVISLITSLDYSFCFVSFFDFSGGLLKNFRITRGGGHGKSFDEEGITISYRDYLSYPTVPLSLLIFDNVLTTLSMVFV